MSELITVDFIRLNFPILGQKPVEVLQLVVDKLRDELVTTVADLEAVTRDSLASKLPALALDALKPKPAEDDFTDEGIFTVIDRYNVKRRRIEGNRPERLLSYVSKSHAFQNVRVAERLKQGVDFFFPLVETEGLKSTAFLADGPDFNKDESKCHHPYFVAQAKLLVQATELGLDFPQICSADTNDLVKISSLLGEGATSIVYAANFQGQDGVLKLLKSGFEHLADHEEGILTHLRHSGVSSIPENCIKVRDGALFFGEKLTRIYVMKGDHVEALVDCLEGTHRAGVVHRDIRPDNIMQDRNGDLRLIDWGFAHRKLSEAHGQQPPTFAGTFRYAGDEVLESMIRREVREPQPHDDLESVARLIIAMVYSLHGDLDIIKNDDLAAAQQFWHEKQKANPKFAWVFEAAKALEYKQLKEVLFR